MRTTLLALAILSAPWAAHAQAVDKYNPPAPIRPHGPAVMVAPGTPPSTQVIGRAVDNGGPGANTTIVHSGTGAATVMTDSAVGGNAEQQTRGVPQAGGGGSVGGG